MPTTPKKTMVCVTVQKTCERLIREGAKQAGGAGLSVVHVARNGAKLLGGGTEGEALEYLFRIAREYGAEMEMIRAEDVVETVVDLVKQNSIECVVVGAGGTSGAYDFSGQIRARMPGVAIVVA